jgi:hypothetical protein
MLSPGVTREVENGREDMSPTGGRLARFRMLMAAAAIAIGAATAAPLRTRAILPIRIRDAGTALRSEGLAVGSEDCQHAGKCKCHNTH